MDNQEELETTNQDASTTDDTVVGGPDFQSWTNETRNYRKLSLWLAAKRGNVRDVELLLKSPVVDPNEVDRDLRTALWWAAWCTTGNQTKIAELLLANDRVDVNPADFSGQTPLHIACMVGNVEVVKLLVVEANLDINRKCFDNHYGGTTPLHAAVYRGHREIVELLLAQDDISVNAPDANSNTPLHLSIKKSRDDKDLARLLLSKKGIDATLKNRDGQSPVERAVVAGRADLVDELLTMEDSASTKANEDRKELAFIAAEYGHAEVMATLLAHSEDVGSQAKNKRTPLHYAAEQGHTDVVKLLLEVPDIDKHAKDAKFDTPLLLAARRQLTAVEKLFLAQDNAGIPHQSSHELALIIYAVQNREPDVVRMLLKGDQGQKYYNSALGVDNRTLMWLAANKEDEEMIETLLEWDRETLHLLVREGKLPVVKLLLKAGYDPDIMDEQKQTPLHVAISHERLDIAKQLIEAKANVDHKDSNGNTPIRLAVAQRSYKLIEVLLQSSAKTRDFTAKEWLDAYDRKSSDTLLLSEDPSGKQRVGFIERAAMHGQLRQIKTPVGPDRRLFVVPTHLSFQDGWLPHASRLILRNKLHTFVSEYDASGHMVFSVVVWFPAGQDHSAGKHFRVPDEEQYRVMWTTASTWPAYRGMGCPSMDHFSTLPYGWMPDDGVDFVKQILEHLTGRWMQLCDQAEDHLATCRLDQLRARGQSQEIILRLAQDAQTWSSLRTILKTQMCTARGFAREYCQRYNKGQGENVLVECIAVNENSIIARIERLDQAIRDLLQLEFAWVSITEAHRSTSLATSMKRLSWVTFIFLPAMFASSLFGMNVNILDSNPDWRWALLTGSICLTTTICAWLVFKYCPIERWLESTIGGRIERFTRKDREA